MRKIAILDMDSIAYVIGNGNKVLDGNGQPKREDGRFVYVDKTENELRRAADTVMKDILTSCRAGGYIGYIKGDNTTDYRKSINPSYKSNRKEEPPSWWNFVKFDLVNRWKIKVANNHEVDDYVNVTRFKVPNSFICAIDKDLLSLVGTHFDWKKRTWVTVSEPEAQKYFWRDMIAGQPGDNVKGIPGRGTKFYEGLVVEAMKKGIELRNIVFEQYVVDFGESEGIYEFYKNYTSLKILDNMPLFIPEAFEPFGEDIEQIENVEKFFIE